MKNILKIFLATFLLIACEKDDVLPVGFEHVSKDGRSHFIYISQPEFLGDKVLQRKVGRTICTKIFKEEDYCEVYYFSNREEIPLKFPIVNRIRPVGTYELKSGKEGFKVLGK